MKQYWNSYYISNGGLILLYMLIRFFSKSPAAMTFKDAFLPKSVASNREAQVLITGALVVLVKYIRCPTWEMFLFNLFFFAKACFATVLYFINVWALAWYLVACAVVWMACPLPFYLPEHRFSDVLSVSQFESLVNNSKENWVFLFYSPRSSDCASTMSLWCDLSVKYTTKALKFAKVNADEAVFLCKKCVVDTSAYSKQLPSLIVYEKGKEAKRFPPVGPTGELPVTVNYKTKPIVKFLGIDRLYLATRDLN
jgi:hypothetical protein